MSPSDRFKPVQKIANNKERKAAAALGESLKEQKTAEQKLLALQGYHAEYLEKLRDSSKRGLSAAQLREYQAFLNKLETAISEQQHKVESSRQDTQSSRAQWQNRYTKSKAMEKAVDRMRADEEKEEGRKEQKLSDEHAQRKRSH